MHVTVNKMLTERETTHHVWVVGRSDSLVVKIVPVDRRKESVVLYFQL